MLFRSLAKASKNKEAGTSAGLVIAIMVGFALVWAAFYGISSWIYGSTRERAEKNQKEMVELANKNKKKEKPREQERDVGGYQAQCSGFLWKTCDRKEP